MKTILITAVLASLLMVSGAMAAFTYQETPDATEVIGAWGECGGSVIDGDWDTEACSTYGVIDTVNMNYTIPVWATSNSLWQTKGFNDGMGPVTSNISLSGCDLGTGTLMFQVQSFTKDVPGTKWNGWSCWDGVSWTQLRYSEGPNPNNAYVYDEAMYWSDEVPTTTTIPITGYIPLVTGTGIPGIIISAAILIGLIAFLFGGDLKLTPTDVAKGLIAALIMVSLIAALSGMW